MAMLFRNDLNKDPRQQARTHAAHERVALSASSLSLSLFAILSTAVGQKGSITVSAGSRTSSNPAVAGWSFVGKRWSFLSFFFSICGSVFYV
jgi:hypothetical protein